MRESNFSSSNNVAYEKLKWKIFSAYKLSSELQHVDCSDGNELPSGKIMLGLVSGVSLGYF